MNSLFIQKVILTFCIGVIGPATAFSAVNGILVSAETTNAAGQTGFAEITVNGRTLTGPNSAAHRRDGRILLPVEAVAKALGDNVEFDRANRSVKVRRLTGDIAEFFADHGRISENGSIVLAVSNPGEIIFTPNIDEFVLPLEIAAAFFDASIRYDDVKLVVTVTRGGTAVDDFSESSGRSRVDLYQMDYEYGINRYGYSTSQNLILTAAGRIGDGRFRFSSNASSVSHSPVSIRNASFILERPNGQLLQAGDFGTGSDLQFLSANIRGGSVTVPAGGMIVTSFAGRSYSGVFLPATSDSAHCCHGSDRLKYDTSLFGGSVSTNTGVRSRTNPWIFSAGAMSFSSVARQGTFASGSINHTGSRVKIRGDAALGKFSGMNPDGSRSGGVSSAVDIAGTFQASDELSFHGRIALIGRSFLSPQMGVRDPVDLRAAGVTWSPVKWLSASFNASSMTHPGDGSQKNKYATAAFAINPSRALPRFYVSHTQSDTAHVRSAAFTLVNASKEFSRLRIYLNGSRIKNAGPAAVNGQIGAAFAVGDTNSVDVSHGIGSRGMLHGQIDWRSSGLINNKLSFGAGVGYQRRHTSPTSVYNRLSVSMSLPRQTTLQANYYNSSAGPTLIVSIKGNLFKKREGDIFLGSAVSQMNSYGSVSGRVYQDIDMNGRFDAEIDKPLADAKVRVDGNRYVVTDNNGLYNIESITAGDHTVYLDLLSIRADLTLLSDAGRETTLRPGGNSTFDFRLVRTGRISGRVWRDGNENGQFDDGELALADVRIVTSSGRDTLTDSNGKFVIGDLPPGEYIVYIDEKTIPEKTRSGPGSLAVKVLPGREAGEIKLSVIAGLADVKTFPAKPD